MRIAFTGAHSTGKTTLLNELKNDKQFNLEYEFIDEITRRMTKKGLKINEGGDDMTQILIMTEHIRNVYGGRADRLVRSIHQIYDRCALDGIVYSHWLLDKGKINRSCFDACELIYKKLKNKYDVIFYTSPKDVKLVDDGERSIDIHFREDIISLFNMYMDSYKGKIVVLEGPVEERLQTIKETLESYNIAIKI